MNYQPRAKNLGKGEGFGITFQGRLTGGERLREIELSAGMIEYEDTEGLGPVVVLLHGLVMNGSLWRHVVRDLRADHRCIVPTLPLGGHRWPMRADADLSPRGIGRLEAELLEKLNLHDVTLVGNDSGLYQIAAGEYPERIGRLVLTSCEAFENFPPGLPGFTISLAAKLPGGLNALAQPMRLRVLRRLPFAYGWMTKRPIPHAVTDAWLHPLLTRREIRRDITRYIRASKKGEMLAAAERLRSFDRPALVVWAKEDRVMPPSHGRRLAELLPQGRLIEIADSYTLIPEDQPGELAHAIRQFIRDEL
jgi:pimeloyl-ACP methyl ester carboxylesterase